jgi:hypothetical protein
MRGYRRKPMTITRGWYPVSTQQKCDIKRRELDLMLDAGIEGSKVHFAAGDI